MIRGEKVTLRTIRESDLDTLLDLICDLENRGDYVPLDLPSQAGIRKRFHEDGFLGTGDSTLVICAEEKLVGTISFMDAGYHDGLELGYAIFDEADRGKGYATDALSSLTTFLLATRQINRLQVSIMPGNVASKRVAEKCGFQFEGTMRGAVFHRGAYRDMDLYSLLRAEVDLS